MATKSRFSGDPFGYKLNLENFFGFLSSAPESGYENFFCYSRPECVFYKSPFLKTPRCQVMKRHKETIVQGSVEGANTLEHQNPYTKAQWWMTHERWAELHRSQVEADKLRREIVGDLGHV